MTSRRGVRGAVPEGFHTIKDASEQCGISETTLRRWRLAGYFVPERFERHGVYVVPYYSDQEIKTLKKIKRLGKRRNTKKELTRHG